MDTYESRRRSQRHAVDVHCAIQSDLWDEPVPLRVTELSADSVWVESELALETGEQVVLSLSLPEPFHQQPVWAVGSVARVGFYRRNGEQKRSGMGLSLSYVRSEDTVRLLAALASF